MNYGLPYKGSKNAIAEKVVSLFPKRKHFYDLFCGGCAITHKALLDGKFETYTINDINADCPTLFEQAIKGKYKDEKRWISKEDFKNLSEPYVRFCWSFGNNLKNYLYGEVVEPWKKALHYARVLGDFSLFEEMGIKTDGTQKDIKEHHNEYKEKYIKWYLEKKLKSVQDYEELKKNLESKIAKNEEELRLYLCDALKKSGLTQREVGRRLNTQMERHYFGKSQWEFPTRENYDKMREFLPLEKSYDEIYGLQDLLQSLQSLQSLERLQRLQRLQSLQSLESLKRLQSLQSLERLERFNKSYDEIEIKENSLIYCDIPYRNTDAYLNEFDYEKFYEWCRNQKELVIISEYSMPVDFICIKEIEKQNLLCGGGAKKSIEKLFIPKHQKELYDKLMKKEDLQLYLFDDVECA